MKIQTFLVEDNLRTDLMLINLFADNPGLRRFMTEYLQDYLESDPPSQLVRIRKENREKLRMHKKAKLEK